MRKTGKVLWVIVCIFFLMAVGINIIIGNIAGGRIGQDEVFRLVDSLTETYQMRQVLVSVLVYCYGYIVVTALLNGKKCEGWKIALAFPTAIAVWGGTASVVLFLNVPFTPLTMCIVCGVLLLICLYTRYKIIINSLGNLAKEAVGSLAVAIVVSTGAFSLFLSSDSYYYVMQYGELIANNNILCMDLTAVFMTWTGITPALISSLAAMCGFETIYVIHYMLVFSMFLGVGVAVYEQADRIHSKIYAAILSVLAILFLILVPYVWMLSTWTISNTYFMLYMFFFLYIASQVERECDYGVSLLMALFGLWMILSRAEGAVVVCFLIVVVSSLDLSRKQMLVIAVPAIVGEFLFLGKVHWDIARGMRQATESILTFQVEAIMIGLMLLTLGYILLYDWVVVNFIRERLNWMLLLGLIAGNLVLALGDFTKYWGNVQTVAYNLKYEYWGPFPWVALILMVLIKIKEPKVDYWDLAVYGYILYTFALCMGRKPLRAGFGDSYNRILAGIVPIFVVASLVKTMRGKNERMNE